MPEMKEAGVPLIVALTYDTLWKSLPSKPRSPAVRDVTVFVELISEMRDRLQSLPERYVRTNLAGRDLLKALDDVFYEHTSEACKSVPGLSKVYPFSVTRMRGVGQHWTGYQPQFSSYKWLTETLNASWSDVIKPKRRSTQSSGSRVQRDEVQRNGDDHRKGADVIGEDFIKTFAYSGVEYGNWTNVNERRKHLNFAFDSMMDFAKIMGWEPSVLSLGGRLGLCIGSRGTGGSRAASAHFEPANMAINLTRMRGDGSLAHEYFHAVATHYGKIATGNIADVTDTLAYGLRERGEVSFPGGGAGLRDEVREAFFNLMVAIMRKPGDGADITDVASYTALSDMLEASIKQDGNKKGKAIYWSTPHEMFARAMEIWTREHLAEKGHRNDYLVGPMKSGDLYPDEEHLKRISYFASSWMEALKTEIRSVKHPFLGDVDIPVLYSRMTACEAFGRADLERFAKSRLTELFGEAAPGLAVVDQGLVNAAGMYELATNLITLREGVSDQGTFYHEAWHACHHTLLTEVERKGLDSLFSPGTPTSDKVIQAMEQEGWAPRVMELALTNPQEMAAYAFQLWVAGKLSLDAGTSEFRRTKTFVDGVVEVADLFVEEDAHRLFSAFASGHLASGARMATECSADWDVDERAKIVWIPEALNQDDAGAASQWSQRMG